MHWFLVLNSLCNMESKGFGKPLLEGLWTEESHETPEPPIPSYAI